METRKPRYECPRCHRLIRKDPLSTVDVFAWHLEKSGDADCLGSYDEIPTDAASHG